ncbi:MAG TPA: amino acid permease [Puia sp.]|nr:amino acid permease [Puia sp.]
MQENLKRDIGAFSLACTVVNMMIGTGIFVLPALAAEKLGAAAIICFFICGLLIFLIALCFAEVGSKVKLSGGAYTYIEMAFGPFVGFVSNNLFWFGSCVLGDAGIASALAKTLAAYIPFLNTAFGQIIFYIFLFGILTLINIRGAKYGARFSVITAFLKLAPIVLIIILGMDHIVRENLAWKQVVTLHNIGSGTLILFYAFVGIETAVNNGGEFKNPAKTVPRGIFSGILFVLLIYICIQLVSQGILGDRLLAVKDAPLAAVANQLFGAAGITLVIAGFAMSTLGTLNGEILGNTRILFAGARDGLMPKFLAKVHPKFRTPHVSIIVYSALGFLFAAIGAYKQLLVLSSASTLLIYLGVVLATIKLRRKNSDASEKSFVIPGGITVPVIAVVIILWILSSLSKEEIAGISIFLAVLSIIFLCIKLVKGRNKSLGIKD